MTKAMDKDATPHQSVILVKRSEDENPGKKVEKEGGEGLDSQPERRRMTKVREQGCYCPSLRHS